MNDVNLRLKKVIGQLNGIMRMMEDGEDCEKIIIQFQAAKAALNRAFSQALNENLDKCLRKKDKDGMKNIVELITKK